MSSALAEPAAPAAPDASANFGSEEKKKSDESVAKRYVDAIPAPSPSYPLNRLVINKSRRQS